MRHRFDAIYDPVPVGSGYPPIDSIQHLYHFYSYRGIALVRIRGVDHLN
jgi:hypothetical protein